MVINYKNVISVFFLFLIFTGSGVMVNAQESVLDNYIQQALESNVSFKQKQLSYEKSLYTLKEARRMFFPTVSVVAEYSFNEGGRTINMPFGDMLNPVYENLNLLNQSYGSQNPNYPDLSEYPSLDNTTTSMTPKEQQFTLLSLEMPIFNAALIYNQNMNKQLSEIEQVSVNIFKNELVKEIKISYIDYKVILKKIEVTQKALDVASSSLNISNSLYKNDKVTIDEVYKAEAQVKKVKKEIIELTKAEILKKAYFNFLLNRKYNEEIIIEEIAFESDYLLLNLDVLIAQALQAREEIKLQDKNILLNETQVKLQNSGIFPVIQVEANAGYWSEDYTFSNETDYASLEFSMKWELFTSGQKRSKVQQAKVDKLIAVEKKNELENNITLEVIEAYQNVKSAKESIELSELELKNYKASFEIIEKKKAQGRASQLEYDSAFTDFFDASISLLNNQNTFYLRIVELEFSINN